MKQSNCSDLKCLREAPTSVLIAANNDVTQTTGSGPVVDDDFVPDLLGKLMLDGRYHKTLVSVIAANNNHEVGFLGFNWSIDQSITYSIQKSGFLYHLQ